MEIKSQLLKEPKVNKTPDYSDEEIKYINKLQSRLEDARTLRDSKHDEFDGMSFVEHWQLEEKLANTFIEPKQNKSDTNFQSGTMRDKIFEFLSNLVNLDLSPDIHAFDSNEMEITRLGQAMEKIIDKTHELDGDDEKKLLRWYELLKHGYVFIEEIWEEKHTYTAKWIKKFEGKIKNVQFKKTLKLLYARPVRTILSGINVYLGDITKYNISEQPFIFTIKYPSYSEAESKYGAKDENGKDIWERWQYVTKDRQEIAPNTLPSIVYNTWRLTETMKDSVEEIHYQDKFGNDYAILLNGVLMTPIGMPFPWGWQDYNITQQNLEPIHSYFAYGKSLVSRKRTGIQILDEFLRMGVLKTQKSFAPPRGNLTGRVVSSRVFMPGVITHGLNPAEIPPLDAKEVSGITNSELAMIQELKKNIDSGAMSNPITGVGQQKTATEVLDLQRQAKISLGLIMFSISLLEWKLSWLRLFNILEKWFEPIDSVLDEARNELQNRYRTLNTQSVIENKGVGRSVIYPTDKEFSPDQVSDEEQRLSKQYNQPFQITVINPEILKQAKVTWQITITPKEKKTSEISKLMFRAMMQDIQLFGQSINFGYLQEKFATVWDEDSNKLFTKGQQMPQMGMEGNKENIPGLPNIESGMKPAVKNEIMTS